MAGGIKLGVKGLRMDGNSQWVYCSYYVYVSLLLLLSSVSSLCRVKVK
jgi:hypothetical protein